MNDWIEPTGNFALPTDLVEECFNSGSFSVLVNAKQLPATFLDLSSGVAGEWLQKCATYQVRLAVVAAPELLSSHFAEFLREEIGRKRFGVFPTEGVAREFLADASASGY